MRPNFLSYGPDVDCEPCFNFILILAVIVLLIFNPEIIVLVIVQLDQNANGTSAEIKQTAGCPSGLPLFKIFFYSMTIFLLPDKT